jgi:Terpene cyclase DEP1
MPSHKIILAIVLLAFGIQGLYVLGQVGYWGIWINNLNHPAGQQVFADLLISLGLVMVWMWHDAKATGRNVWPWLVATLALGSFGPLIYLLTRKSHNDAW